MRSNDYLARRRRAKNVGKEGGEKEEEEEEARLDLSEKTRTQQQHIYHHVLVLIYLVFSFRQHRICAVPLVERREGSKQTATKKKKKKENPLDGRH